MNDQFNDKFRRMIKWIRETELDILCIQEHNAGATKLKEWKRIAHANGLCIRLGTRRETTARGGAALIAKMSTFDMCEKDSGRQRELEGGIATLKCNWQNQKLQFVSLYVPSQEQDRKIYLTKLKRSGVITKNSIVLGDFNCVENTNIHKKARVTPTQTTTQDY
jgi:exonuclease III